MNQPKTRMNEMNGYDVEDLHLGMRATYSETITEADSAIDRERRRVTLETVCRVGETVVIDGQALVMTTSTAKRQPKAAAAVVREPAPV